MKTAMLFVCSTLLLAGTMTAGQAKAVHFKKLQEFLPKAELDGFERKKPTGQTQTTMGMTTSEAKVRYETKHPEQENAENTDIIHQTIEITISDMSGIPYGQMAAMAYQGDFENETEDGYEKSIMVNKTYRGKESAQTGDYKRCSLEFAVGKFVIKLEANNTDDVSLLHKLAADMNLGNLEKVTP